MKNTLFSIILLVSMTACQKKSGESAERATDSVTQAIKAGLNTETVLNTTELAGVKIGDDLAEVLKRQPSPIKKSVLQTGEGDFLIYDIFDVAGEKIGYLFPDPVSEKKVDNIVLTSPKIKAANGIKVGDTYGDLLKLYGKIEVNGSEIEGWTHATAKDFSYKLDTNIWNPDVDESTISLRTKIIYIQTN